MPEEKKDKQDRMVEVLEELLKWTKVTSIPHVKKLLSEILPTDEEKRAYHYSDGRDSRAVAKFAGVGHVAVTRWWKAWVRAGIAETISAKRGSRAKSIFSLEDFGIAVPPPIEAKTKEEEQVPTIPIAPSEEKVSQEETKEEEKLE